MGYIIGKSMSEVFYHLCSPLDVYELIMQSSFFCIFQVLKLSWWVYTSLGHIAVLLLIVGTVFDLLQSLEISSVLHKLLKMITNDSENILAASEVL